MEGEKERGRPVEVCGLICEHGGQSPRYMAQVLAVMSRLLCGFWGLEVAGRIGRKIHKCSLLNMPRNFLISSNDVISCFIKPQWTPELRNN